MRQFTVYNPANNVYIFSGQLASGKTHIANWLKDSKPLAVTVFDNVDTLKQSVIDRVVENYIYHQSTILITNDQSLAEAYYTAIFNACDEALVW